MTHAIPDRPHLSDGAAASDHHSPPSGPPRRSRLSHRQARGALALLLDATTERELVGRLRQHVDGCARCQGDLEELRRAEAWLLAQPVEAPQMGAMQEAAWAAIQVRIAAENALAPVAEKVLSNGHTPDAYHHASPEASALVPLVASSDGADASEADRLYRPVPARQPLTSVIIPFRVFGKSGVVSTRGALLVALAASLIVGSFGALFLAHFSAGGAPVPTTHEAPSVAVLDPGNETPTFSFDPTSRRLLALTSDDRFDCERGRRCPASQTPLCLRFSMLDADTGKSIGNALPGCMKNSGTGSTYIDLLDNSAIKQAMLIGSDQEVTTLDSQTGATVWTYHLACCPAKGTSVGKALFDARDQLLLTMGLSNQDRGLQTLDAQSVMTGQVQYQAALSGAQYQAAILSNVSGWLYLWTACAADSDASCVEIYEAGTGRKIGDWRENFQTTPLAADPASNVLYVRKDQPDGQAETLVVDGGSGQPLSRLPPAHAVAVNGSLHHIYLLDENGVTVVDSRTRRKLSTLPVLVHDTAWATPAIDEQNKRVYLPTVRGKVLTAQDNAEGQLRLLSPALQATLDAERAMTVAWAQGAMDIDPWDLPIGPGSLTFYYPLGQDDPGGCSEKSVAARTEAAATPLSGGAYTVQISMNWANPSTVLDASALSGSPPPLPSYPHQHTWLYHIPASGGAEWRSEQGEAFSTCQAA